MNRNISFLKTWQSTNHHSWESNSIVLVFSNVAAGHLAHKMHYFRYRRRRYWICNDPVGCNGPSSANKFHRQKWYRDLQWIMHFRKMVRVGVIGLHLSSKLVLTSTFKKNLIPISITRHTKIPKTHFKRMSTHLLSHQDAFSMKKQQKGSSGHKI